MNIINKAGTVVKDFFRYWKKPASGNYVSNKEVIAYSVGGMGVQFIVAVSSQILLQANCLLIGSVYGLKPTDLALLLMINTIISIVIQPFKSWLIDNTPGKQGKARPWLLWLGPPCAILMSLTAFIPLSWSKQKILICVGVLYTVMNFIYQFYLGMYTQLVQLETPNTNERAKIISISSIIYSMAPTITGAAFPLIASFFDLGQVDQNFYRVIFPVFSFLGCGLGFFAYFGTKERIILPRRQVQKVKFFDGFVKICKNRYFWINNISTWFTFARTAITGSMMWAYVYMLQNEGIQAVASVVIGTASLVGMVMGPFMIKKMGKRNTVLITDVVFAASMIPLIFYNDNFYMFAAMCYIAFWSSAVQIITTPAMSADALDYQQWKTGDRLEGFSQNFAIINSLVAIGTNYILPFIYEYYGLINDKDVLYDAAVRSPLLSAMALLAVIGGVMHAVPFIFWNMTEKDQARMIEDLKRRAHEQNVLDGCAEASLLSSDEHLNEEGFVDIPAESKGAVCADETSVFDSQDEAAASEDAKED